MSDLKPCPFCGGEAKFGEVTTEDADDSGGQYVECSKCGACTCLMFPVMEAVKELLAEKWNARPDSLTLTAAVQGEREACAMAAEALRDEARRYGAEGSAVCLDLLAARIRSRGPAPAVDVSPRGVWRCECCGEMFDGISPEWRMSAGQMAHKCPGNDPQAGYFTARFFPDTSPAPAGDVMAVVREYVEAYDDYQEAINFKKTCRNDESVTVAADRRIKAGLALRALVDGKGEAKDGGAK